MLRSSVTIGAEEELQCFSVTDDMHTIGKICCSRKVFIASLMSLGLSPSHQQNLDLVFHDGVALQEGAE